MKSAQILREKIAGDRPVLGMLLTYDLSIELIELSMKAGLDFMITHKAGHLFITDTLSEEIAAL